MKAPGPRPAHLMSETLAAREMPRSSRKLFHPSNPDGLVRNGHSGIPVSPRERSKHSLPDICSGDHPFRRSPVTRSRNPGAVSILRSFGRLRDSRAAASPAPGRSGPATRLTPASHGRAGRAVCRQGQAPPVVGTRADIVMTGACRSYEDAADRPGGHIPGEHLITRCHCQKPRRAADGGPYLESESGCPRSKRRRCFVCFLLPGGSIIRTVSAPQTLCKSPCR